MITSSPVFLLAVALSFQVAASRVEWYGQCGGKGYEGPTTCFSGSECKEINAFYSQCEPLPPGERPGPYEQCGGRGYDGFLCDGIQCCSSGLECIFINEYFSQCIPEFSLADVGEPCGPATPDNKKCLLNSRASGPVFIKCSSDTDPDAKCVECGFRGLACCPPGLFRPDRPPCQAAPRFTPEIPCNTEADICEGDIIVQS